MWLQEAHAFNAIEEYVHHPKGQPDSAAPTNKLTGQVAEGVKQALKGQPREEINRAVRQACRDVLFLFFLHQQVNGKLLSENRYYWTLWLLLSKELKSLLREQSLDRQIRWNRIRIEMQMPHPLEPEAAAAAQQHHVLTWEVLEEGDDLGQWVIESFLADGKTALPDGAYGMIGGAKPLYSKVPTEAEVTELFEDAESFKKFLAGDDYSYGLADVSDAEYDAHYEALVSAIKGVVQEGTVVDLPTVPHAFLREAPLVDGDWVDLYTLQLAEWGARLMEKAFLLEDSHDHHPMAWQKITDPKDGPEVDAAVTKRLWQQTRKHLAGFPGRTMDIEDRLYISFSDYMKWKARRCKGDLWSGMRIGLGVVPWNQWVDEHSGEGMAALAGIEVGKLSCYLDGYRYRECRDARELAGEVGQREALLDSLQNGRPDTDDERFRRRVEHWKTLALGFLPEIYILRRAIDSINQRYFDGQQPLFPALAEGFAQLLALVEKTVGIYNGHLAEEIEHLECLINQTGDGHQASILMIDSTRSIENAQEANKNQVCYLVDMAKADALEMLGENGKACQLLERHV